MEIVNVEKESPQCPPNTTKDGEKEKSSSYEELVEKVVEEFEK